MIYLQSGTFSEFSVQLSTISGGTASYLELISGDSRAITQIQLIDLSPTTYYSRWIIDCTQIEPSHYFGKFYDENDNLIKTDLVIVSKNRPPKEEFDPQLGEKKTFNPLDE